MMCFFFFLLDAFKQEIKKKGSNFPERVSVLERKCRLV